MSLLQLAALEFPPKKLFGNRDERMVAERRNHLEVTRSIPGLMKILAVLLWKRRLIYFVVCFAVLSEEPVPGDAVVLQLASQSRRRRPLPPHQTRHLRVLSLLQEGRLRVQQPRHRLTGKKVRPSRHCCAPKPFSKPKKLGAFFLPGQGVRESPGRSERK